MKRYWKVGIVLLCLVCMGCGGNASQSLPNPTFLYAFDGDGKSKEHPMYTTIEELNAHPEKYRDKMGVLSGIYGKYEPENHSEHAYTDVGR